MALLTGLFGKILPFMNFGGKQGLKGSILPVLIAIGLIFYSFTSYKEGVQTKHDNLVQSIKEEEREKLSLELQISQKDAAIKEYKNSIESLRRQNELSRQVESELKDKVSEISTLLDVANKGVPEEIAEEGKEKISNYLESGLRKIHEIEYNDKQ